MERSHKKKTFLNHLKNQEIFNIQRTFRRDILITSWERLSALNARLAEMQRFRPSSCRCENKPELCSLWHASPRCPPPDSSEAREIRHAASFMLQWVLAGKNGMQNNRNMARSEPPIAHSQRCFGGEVATAARPAQNTHALPTNAASWLANNTSDTDSIKKVIWDAERVTSPAY